MLLYKFISTMEDLITCPICMEVFGTPRMLPCQHTFCEQCLTSYISARREELTRKIKIFHGFSCPVCRKGVKSNGKDTDGSCYPKNYTVQALLDHVNNTNETSESAMERKTTTTTGTQTDDDNMKPCFLDVRNRNRGNMNSGSSTTKSFNSTATRSRGRKRTSGKHRTQGVSTSGFFERHSEPHRGTVGSVCGRGPQLCGLNFLEHFIVEHVINRFRKAFRGMSFDRKSFLIIFTFFSLNALCFSVCQNVWSILVESDTVTGILIQVYLFCRFLRYLFQLEFKCTENHRGVREYEHIFYSVVFCLVYFGILGIISYYVVQGLICLRFFQIHYRTIPEMNEKLPIADILRWAWSAQDTIQQDTDIVIREIIRSVKNSPIERLLSSILGV